jgi:5-methylcytosine-specific restriction endonuclease McrA
MKPTDELYKTWRWQRRRAEHLAGDPLCWMCADEGIVTEATVADHDPPHRGDVNAFWNGRLRSLCKRHHDSDKQRIEKGGKPKPRYGADGWPVGTR